MGSEAEHFNLLFKFVEGLSELEVTVGAKARPVVSAVRARLTEAAALRDKGDLPAALATIHSAMDSLAALASDLDPAEGMMMRMLAERFSQALSIGDKGSAKHAVNLMRHKAGDPKDEPDNEW